MDVKIIGLRIVPALAQRPTMYHTYFNNTISKTQAIKIVDAHRKIMKLRIVRVCCLIRRLIHPKIGLIRHSIIHI